MGLNPSMAKIKQKRKAQGNKNKSWTYQLNSNHPANQVRAGPGHTGCTPASQNDLTFKATLGNLVRIWLR